MSLTAIRAVAGQGVSAVITGRIKEICRQTMLNLGIEVIDGVEGMTVREAIERYKAAGLEALESRKGLITLHCHRFARRRAGRAPVPPSSWQTLRRERGRWSGSNPTGRHAK